MNDDDNYYAKVTVIVETKDGSFRDARVAVPRM